MNADTTRVLLVEDNPGDADLIREMVEEVGGTDLIVADRLSACAESVGNCRPDAILLDLGLPDSSGLNTIRGVRSQCDGVPIVVLTGQDDEQTALGALKNGAQDYLVKGKVDAEKLARSLRYSIERMRAERAVREGEARYRELFDESPISLWEEDFSEVKHIVDRLRSEGVSDLRQRLLTDDALISECVRAVRITRVNRATLKLFGADSPTALLSGLGTIFTQDSRRVFAEELARFAEGNAMFEREAVQKTLNGGTLQVVVSASVAPGYEDTWSRVLVSIADITELVQAQERDKTHAEHMAFLAETAMEFVEFPAGGDIHHFIGERLRRIVGSPAVVVIADFDHSSSSFVPRCLLGHEDKLAELSDCLRDGLPPISRSMTQTAGVSGMVKAAGGLAALRDEAVHGAAVALDGALNVRDVYFAEFARGDEVHGGVTVLIRDGCPDPDLSLIEAFLAQASVALARRHSEQKLRETEEQLRQSQKLESIGQLAGGVAHDFNNMLAVITGYSDVILMSTDPNDPIYEDIRDIREAGNRAAALTRQLLAFSRKQTLKPTVLNLNTAVDDLERMLRRLIGEDIELKTTLAEDLALTEADRGQIDQVMMNLAVNARDAMPRGGSLSIRTSNATVDEDQAGPHEGLEPGAYVMLAVSDSGCGMDDETLKRMFEPFYTTKGLGKGTGLGLSTAYGIIRQSGGSISVHSEKGIGTTFEIYLPRVDKCDEARPEQSPATRAEGGGETILLVEDEDVLLGLASRMLRMAGYKILEATNGGEALLICESHPGPIPLMLTDVIMPKMGGKELAERVASIRPDMKVIYTSGYTDDAITRNGILPPGIPLIEKPFTADDLTRKVREVLDAHAVDPTERTCSNVSGRD